MNEKKRSLYWVLVGPVIALVLAASRFAMQGQVKLYTEPDKKFYMSDPDLGFRLGNDTYHWLGIDRTAAIVALGGFLLVATFLLLRRERKKKVAMSKARLGLWALSPLGVIIPILALLSGTPPENAVASLPTVEATATQGAVTKTDGPAIAASLSNLPAGRYVALDHDGSVIAAAVKAGGDSFEAKFRKGFRGSLTGDPADLSKPFSGEILVSAKSVETGIDLRNTHAAEYFKVEEFPDIAFRFGAITASSKGDSSNRVKISAEGTFTVAGKEVATVVSGTVTGLDDAGKKRLGLGAGPALVVNGSTSIKLSETPIGSKDFDRDEVPINFSLVLVKEEPK